MTEEYLALVACGSPLSLKVPDIAAAAIGDGWNVRVVATPSGLDFLDAAAVERVTGFAPLVAQRKLGEPKRFPNPAQVVVCPATVNMIAKLATGIMDNYATGLICEALASRTPMTIVPMIGDRLWGHPALAGHLKLLVDAGVTFIDPVSGRAGPPAPMEQGTGVDLMRDFDPRWPLPARSPGA